MAKLIPSGVVQLPNFAELQYNLNERERQKQLQFDEFSAQFDKKAGTYLDGDREAVQQSYGEVEKAMNALATDPDNVELRRKLREAYAGYNEIAGTAQFLADNYRQQWSAYNTNPDQFSLGGESAMDVFNRERTSKRDANQILSMASNPFTLAPKYKYDMESPVALGIRAEDVFRKNINDYIREDGTIDMDKARDFIMRFTDSHYADPNQVKNAIIYEGVSQGMIGRNGEITSRADLDIIDTEGFAPQRDVLAGQFKDKAVEAFLDRIPRMGVNQFELDQRRQEMALKREIAGAKGAGFPRMQIRQATQNKPIVVDYKPPVKTDEFGTPVDEGANRKSTFTAQAVIDIPSGSSPIYLDPSNGEEYRVKKVMYDLEGNPYFLRSFKQGFGGKEENVFDVQLVTDDVFGAFSKADREFLTYVMGNAQMTDNADPLEIF
jgi:hypothetical protein